MRVALVHECIVGYHGSERVLAALAAMYPDAPIFVTLVHREVLRGTPLEPSTFIASRLDRWPVLRRRHRWLLPLFPGAVESHDLRGFDVVISSHHAAAHGVLTRADQVHVCYTHSPARYAWDLYHDHLPPTRWSPVKRVVMRRFRQWDYAAGQRPDVFIANSSAVAARIAKVYRRDAAVVHPPVDVERFAARDAPDGPYVALGRFVPYKRFEVVVAAFNALRLPLVVIGGGPGLAGLRGLAGPTVTIATGLDDTAVAARLRDARALVFAGEEDFGIGLVEALAAGTPVLARDAGGAREIVDDGVTGMLFDGDPVDAVAAAVRRFEAEGVSGDATVLRRSAERFAPVRFAEGVRAVVARACV